MAEFEEIKTRRDESLIPNSQIETMFLRIANDEQMKQYVELCEHGHQSLATAYASNAVFRLFFALVEKFGGDIEELKKTKKEKGKHE